jgi:LAO/AO transport system kinase
MEIADIFVINKADREGAERVEKEVRAMQSLAGQHDSWVTPIVKTIATTGEGIEDLLAAIERMRAWLAAEERLEARRKAYWRERIEEMVRRALLKKAGARGLSAEELSRHAQRIAAGQEDPYRLVPWLVARVFGCEGQELRG